MSHIFPTLLNEVCSIERRIVRESLYRIDNLGTRCLAVRFPWLGTCERNAHVSERIQKYVQTSLSDRNLPCPGKHRMIHGRHGHEHPFWTRSLRLGTSSGSHVLLRGYTVSIFSNNHCFFTLVSLREFDTMNYSESASKEGEESEQRAGRFKFFFSKKIAILRERLLPRHELYHVNSQDHVEKWKDLEASNFSSLKLSRYLENADFQDTHSIMWILY